MATLSAYFQLLCLVVLPGWCFGAFVYVMCQFTANKYEIRNKRYRV